MRRSVRRAVGALLFLAVGMALYAGWVVYEARAYTAGTLLPRIAEGMGPLRLDDLTPRQIDILLAVEDPAFFTHKGIDLSTPGAGITTMTQGLVKWLYFEKFKPGFAKLRQTLIARFVFDPMVDKETQLALFVNLVPMGGGLKGFQAASQTYFDRPFGSITEEEYLRLVAMIIAPATFNVRDHPERNALRVERIKRLVEGRYRPQGLFDLYYGPLDTETQKGLPAFSYFPSYYQ